MRPAAIEYMKNTDHRDVPPCRGEGGDDAEGGHAEIEAHDRPEHLGLVSPLDGDGHGLGEDGGWIDSVTKRDRHEDRRDDQKKELHHAAFPPECRLADL